MNKCFLIPIFLLAAGGCALPPLAGQSDTGHAGHEEPAPALDEPIELIPHALGPYTWPIDTDNQRAQAYFDQGMQLRYAYNVDDAARSMVEAQRADPQCAMCYWGEAFALGSFLNGGMSARKAKRAHAAITRASELAASSESELERDLIRAATVRYPADYDPDNRRPVDEAFAAAMEEVYRKYPRHPDVATVYAVSLFLLEDRRGYRDIDDPDVQRLHGVLEEVLADDIRHPGACHLYIHATESSQRPDLALPCAEHLGESMPAASHIQHMPSHTWNEVGQWGRSVRANIAAWHADQKAERNAGFSYAPTHNLHMLLFAASFDGQGAIATQAGKDYRKLSGNPMFELLTLIRFGRFDEVLEIEQRPDGGVGAAMWDFAHGYASLKQGDMARARQLSERVFSYVNSTDEKFRFHEARDVVGTVAHILDGEIRWYESDLEAAVAAFRRAVAAEDSLGYDEPEPLPFSARHWLGAALYAAGRYRESAEVYREELLDHPQNGWSLYGLRAALAAQGESDPNVNEDLRESWSRADTWITSSKF